MSDELRQWWERFEGRLHLRHGEIETIGRFCARCRVVLGYSYWSDVPGEGNLCMDCHDRWTVEVDA